MKKLLLIAVVAGGLMVAGTTRSDAQVYFSIGFGPGYYGYYPYGYDYPYRYYSRPYYRSYYRPVLLERRASLSQSSSLSLLALV